MAARPRPDRTPPAAPTEGPYPVDPQALRTLAHPLRSRLLAELRSLGPATATDLAERLGTNSGATSYHLRRLAEVGLIADTGAGHGRRREWQAATEGRVIDPGLGGLDDDSADDEAAALWLSRDYIAHFAQKAQAWLTESPEWPVSWQEYAGLDDHLVLVTDEQLASLRDDMARLLARYRRVGAGNPRAKRVTVYTCALPVDPPGRWGGLEP